MNSVIHLNRLTKRYGSKTVVDRLDLQVPAGSIYAFLGDNGAGKTSTIKVLVGMHPPDGGSARILGQDCWTNAIPLRQRVGYVPERPRFYEWMTVAEIGWFTSTFHRPGYLDRYHDWIDRLGLDRKKRLRDLSKGGYARAALALAMAIDPEVLILDEPTSGLDLLTRRDFLASLAELAAAGRTVFISSHGIAELERVATHVGLLSRGKLLFSGALDEIKGRFSRILFRVNGEAPDLSGLGRILHQQQLGRQMELLVDGASASALDRLRSQAGLTDVEGVTPSLEEIYAAVMRTAGASVREGPR